MVKGRSCVAMRLKPILIECVARGYLIGGGWKDYCATRYVCGGAGASFPEGLQIGKSSRTDLHAGRQGRSRRA